MVKVYSGDVIFVCQTPLHFLLTLVLSRKWTGEKAVVWVSESGVDARLVRMVAEISTSRIVQLPGGACVENKVLRMLRRSLNVFCLRFFQRSLRDQSLVVFNDLSPETQYLIASFHSRGGRVFLAEDGVATYSMGGVVPAGVISRKFGKLLYGAWWSPKPKIGLDSRVTAVFSSYPELIRSDVANAKEVLQLPSLVAEDVDSSFDLGLQDCLLCVMPLVSSVSDEDLVRFISVLRVVPHKLVVKLHPREDLLGRERLELLLRGCDYQYLPIGIPVEVICVGNLKLKAIVGYRSSALHLLKFLRSNLKVMYVEFVGGEGARVWRDFYKSVGVVDFFSEYDF